MRSSIRGILLAAVAIASPGVALSTPADLLMRRGTVVSGIAVLRNGSTTSALPGTVLRNSSAAAKLSASDTVSIRSGTWVSLDVTRDGRTIIFDLLGDLWTLPVTGGTATPITRGPAFESQPRIGPDGTQLVYVSDASGSDNLWVAGIDGSQPRRITSLDAGTLVSPAWTADGRALLATLLDDAGSRTAELWRFPIDGGAGSRVLANENGPAALLVSAPSPGPYSAFAMRDGASVLLTAVTPRAYGARAGGSSRLQRLDLTTGRTESIAVAQSNPMRAMVTPDGSTMLYVAQHEGRPGLIAQSRTTGAARWLRYPMQMHALEARASRDVFPGFAVTSDSKTVIVHDAGQFHRIDISTGVADSIPFVAHVVMPSGNALSMQFRVDTGMVHARLIHALSGGPRGQIAVSTLARTMVAAAPRDSLRRLTPTLQPREMQVVWSPDGRTLAYTTWDHSGGALWTARADGRGEPVRLTTGSAFHADPMFSPDGREIAVLRYDEQLARGGASLFASSATLVQIAIATRSARIVADVGTLRHPVYVASGERLAMASLASGVVSMRRDGSDRRTHATITRTLGRVTDMALSPTGTQLAILASGRLWRVPLTLAAIVDTATRALDPLRDRMAPVTTDDPESMGWSVDGETLLYSTGMLVHRATSSGRDSARFSVALPRSGGRGTVVLRRVRAITMRGDEVIPDADIVITDDRIIGIGARGTVVIPAGARELSLAGRTVIPGLIDLHAHWLTRSGPLEPDGSAAWANLAYGVTTLRDPQSAPEIFGLADLADAGAMPSPRVLSTGPGVFTDAGIRSLDDARRIIGKYRTRYGTRYIKSYLVGTRQQRAWVLQACRELGMLPTTEGGSDTKLDLTHAMDGFSGNEHALPTTPLGDDAVQLLARSGIAYTPTLIVGFGGPLRIYDLLRREAVANDPKLRRFTASDVLQQRSATNLLAFRDDDYPTASLASDATRVLRAGGLVGLGGHGEMQGLQNHWEMRLLTEGGMTPHEALRVATLNGARALGLTQDLGSLEPGKLADLVILDRDPLIDIRATTSIHAVMRGGELFDGNTLARSAPRPDTLPTPWWKRTEPAMAHNSAAIDAAVAAELTIERIPGASVTVVQGNRTVLMKGYGVGNVEQGTAVTDATMFQSGSLGKMFTAAGVMALVEDGKVSLDASVRRYLTDAPASWEPITIRHLLSHTAGVPDYTSERFDYRRAYTDGALDSLAYATPLEYSAGARWNYSNTGYVLLGHIITRVTGAPYWIWLRTRVFTPAGMPTARIQSESDVVPNRASGYVLANGAWENQRWVAPELNVTADGSLLLSARDMAAWSATVRDRRVLSAESWRVMRSPVRLASGALHPYGFGWFIDSVGTQEVHQHSGSWQGFRAQFTHWTRADLTIVALTNSGSANPDAIVSAVALTLDPSLVAIPPSTAIRDTSPALTAGARMLLGKIAQGTVEPTDFAYFRQTVFPRMKVAYGRLLRGLAAPDAMELLSERRVGDDRERVYRVRWGSRRILATMKFGVGGGVTGILLREEE